MKWFILTVSLVLAISGVAPGQVTLDYVANPDPAVGYKSYTVQATGVGVNVLGGFTITGQVHQVWTDSSTQSEWINNVDGNTPGNPMDSYVTFGDERLAELPNFFPSDPQGQRVTTETIDGGGDQGLGTLNNIPSGGGSAGQGQADRGDRIPPVIPGDANRDVCVDEEDLQIVAEHWGASTANGYFDGDFNDDGVVDPIDASIAAANWGCRSRGSIAIGGECKAGETDGARAGSGEGCTFGRADAYLSLGTPSEAETTVDLMKLVIPEGNSVTVELEVYTAELDVWDYYTDITPYSFCGENALVVPEPSTLGLLVLGLLALMVSRRRLR
jgi:hypothetical protein